MNKASNKQPILSIKNLRVIFSGEFGEAAAINDVSFDLFPKETLAVVGESGCGKTVTALSILRLIQSPQGKIEKGLIELPLKVNGLEVKVVPISPLAKAQNLEEVNEVMQFFQIANALGPGGMAEVKPDAIAAFVADKLGVPSDLRTSEEEKQMIQKQAMEMSQQMMNAQPNGKAGEPQAAPPDQAPPPQEAVHLARPPHLRHHVHRPIRHDDAARVRRAQFSSAEVSARALRARNSLTAPSSSLPQVL